MNYAIAKARVNAAKAAIRFDYNHNRTRVYPKSIGRKEKLALRGIDLIDQKLLNRFRKPSPKPQFDEANKERLMEIFLPDIERTEKLLSLDLSDWKK